MSVPWSKATADRYDVYKYAQGRSDALCDACKDMKQPELAKCRKAALDALLVTGNAFAAFMQSRQDDGAKEEDLEDLHRAFWTTQMARLNLVMC